MANFYATYSASESSGSAVTASQGTIPWIVAGQGTAGTAATGVVTVQGITSGTPIPISGSITATNPSVGATGAAVPASGTYIAASIAGTLTGLVATANGLKTDVIASALPSGASTSAKQPALGTAGTASADVITVQGITSMTALKVDGTGGTFPISGTVAATQSGTWTVQPGNTANSTPWLTTVSTALPAGSAIIGKVGIDQTTPGTTNGVQVNAALPAGSNIIGNIRIDQTTPGTTNGVQVNAALPAGANVIGAVTQSGTWTVQPGNTANTTPWLMVQSKIKANAPITNDYSSVNVTTSAYVQLVASTTSALTRLYIQDTSGSFMIIATGGAGVEVDQFYYGPGFAGFIDFAIPASTRIAIKALDATASTGRLIMSFFT